MFRQPLHGVPMRYLSLLVLCSVLACSSPTDPNVVAPSFVEVNMTNAEVLAAFDANQPVKSTRIFGADVQTVKEHGAQCVAFETLRALLADGVTVEQWNNM